MDSTGFWKLKLEMSTAMTMTVVNIVFSLDFVFNKNPLMAAH